MYSLENRIYDIFQIIQQDESYRIIWETYDQSFRSLLSLMESLDDAQCSMIQDHLDAFFALHWEMMLLALEKSKTV